MKIVFSGAAGIGKTTTAKALAEKLNVPFLPENFSDYFEAITRLRLLDRPDSSQEERHAATQHYLRTLQEWLNNRAQECRSLEGFVADRWALDMLTAMLAKNVFRQENELVTRVIRHLQQQAAQLDLLVILPLTTAFTNEANESDLPRPRSLNTQLMMHSLCRGLHVQLTRLPVVHVPQQLETVDERVEFIARAAEKIPQSFGLKANR